MPIGPGSRIGPYEVTALIGEGGMGKVWRAHHTALKRDDALKVLPDAFASDPDRLARFRREAQVLASLNHPNIAHVYGLEQADGVQALVMELVEGPTLADRIAQGPIPIDEALPIAKQIAEALEAAHEQGIVHRDLKPANIKVRSDGTVKVLDFGLAKALESTSALGVDATASPTITSPAMMTGVGVLLGTAAYMSPEQARRKAVDKRSDIWAFGCVLYEMLSGRRAFGGEDVTDTIAAVVRTDPEWSALPSDTPPSILRLLHRCLQKDVRERLPDIGSARLEIKDAKTGSDALGPAAPASNTASASVRRERMAWIAGVALLTLAVGTLGAFYWRGGSDTAPQPEMRLEISTPRTNDPRSLALSPDGRQLVFVAIGDDSQRRLWIRPLNAASARELAGTEGAAYPFWSPDSRSIGFFAEDKLKRLDIAGGPPHTVTDVLQGRGGTWNADGVILFASFTSSGNGLFRVAASGGDAAMITRPAVASTDHRFPQFLPDGDRFLFFVHPITGNAPAREALAEAGIYLGTLSSGTARRLVAADSAGLYSRGWVLFIRGGILLAQRLDPSRQELTGDPITIAEDVHYEGTVLHVGAVSVSASGAIAYRTGSVGGRRLTWFDRSGNPIGTMGAVDETSLSSVELSPDGRRVATHRNVLGNTDVWLLDNARMRRFTFAQGDDGFAVWSSDGRQIVFDSSRSGTRELYEKASDGGDQERLLIDVPKGNKVASDVSPDGRFLLFGNEVPPAFDIWVLPLQGDRKPFPFLKTNFDERSSQFSPDGRWVSYISNESGRHEVYVRPFPGPGGQWQISTAGGAQSRWRRDGKEIYYIAPDATLMAVPITVTRDAIEPGTPVPLFQTSIWNGGSALNRIQYDVGVDGRFLINATTDVRSQSPITLLLNWNPARPK